MMIDNSQCDLPNNKKSNLFIDTDYEAADEAKGDSRNSPMYARSNKKTRTSKKKVSFHHTAFVVLIPTVDEYHNAGLSNLLWWNDCDFHSFKVSAADEVKDHMKSLNVSLDAKSALKVYFQQFFNPEDVKNTQHNLQQSYEVLASQRQQLLESLPVDQLPPPAAAMAQQQAQSQTKPLSSSTPPVMIPMPIAQRHDSITSSKFNNNNNTNSHHHQQQSKSINVNDKAQLKQQHPSPFNVVTSQRPPSPPSSTTSPTSSENAVMNEGKVDLAVLARMVALGFFVLINRS